MEYQRQVKVLNRDNVGLVGKFEVKARRGRRVTGKRWVRGTVLGAVPIF